jgi:hypothetical protein
LLQHPPVPADICSLPFGAHGCHEPYPAVKIDDQPGKVQTVRDPALIRSRFMKGLGTGRGGALVA